MSNNAANVTFGKPKVGGGIWRAPLGTTLPTDATTALDNAFVSLGYIADTGVVNNNSPTVETIRAWGGDVVATPQTEKTDTYAFGFLEYLKKEVQETVHGAANVSGDLATGMTVRKNSTTLDEYVYVIEQVLRGGVVSRIVIPDGAITEIGEVSYVDNDVAQYPVTITAMASDALNGDTAREYLKQP